MSLTQQAQLLQHVMKLRNNWATIELPDRDELMAAIQDGVNLLKEPTEPGDDVHNGLHLMARVLVLVEAAIEVGTDWFHRQRRMFYILGDTVHVHSQETDMDHRRWMNVVGDGGSFDDAIRGFVDPTGVYAYKGPSWDLTDEEVEQFKNHIPSVLAAVDSVPMELEVWAGAIPGLPGTRWPGRRKLGRIHEILGVSL